MINYLNKIKQYISNHKKLSIFITIIILVACYYFYTKANSTAGEIKYVTEVVKKGTIISNVSGTGQVSASNQIEIKPNVSGSIISVEVAPGDKVYEGKTLFVIDNESAQKAVRDAEISLKSSKLSLEKLQIQNSNENMNANLVKAYSDGYNTVSSAFLDLPTILSGVEDLLNKANLSDNTARNSGTTAINYRKIVEKDYYETKAIYEKNKIFFSSLDYNSDKNDIDKLITDTYYTSTLLANALKDLNDYVNYLAQDTGRSADYATSISTISGYTNTINGHLSALINTASSIKSNKDTIPNNNIDEQNAQINIEQKQNALNDAQKTLSDYYIKAPFSGIMASVPVLKGDSANTSTILGTIITPQKVAIIPLNEVDVAKISLMQKATLLFDAVADLSISGKVAQIDSIGTVTQGVVNYNVKISFDTNDDRIKPGMSVNASIITNIKQNILVVPNAAVKNQNGSYVETFAVALPSPQAGSQGSTSLVAPNKINVETGISNDTLIEIISGLNEGDIVVVKTINNTVNVAAPKSILGNMGGGGGARIAPRN